MDALGISPCRRFHRGVTQHLHDVVLQHVTQGAGAVVKAAALFHAQRFGGGDFHRAHIIAVPQRLEYRIAKAQRQQVLQAFFAQIMVDAVNPAFGKMAADSLADGAGGRKIGAQRFFQHDAHLRRIESDRGQIGAGVGEKFGGSGKIDDNTLRLPPLHGLRERVEIGAAGDVEPEIDDAAGECRPLRFVKRGFDVDFGFGVRFGNKARGVQIAAPQRDNPPVRMQLARGVRLIECGQQFAHRQIAGGAE